MTKQDENDLSWIFDCIAKSSWLIEGFIRPKDEDDNVIYDLLEDVNEYKIHIKGKILKSKVTSPTKEEDFFLCDENGIHFKYTSADNEDGNMVWAMSYHMKDSSYCAFKLGDVEDISINYTDRKSNLPEPTEEEIKCLKFISSYILNHCPMFTNEERTFYAYRRVELVDFLSDPLDCIIPVFDEQTGILYDRNNPLNHEIPEGSMVDVVIKYDSLDLDNQFNYVYPEYISVISSPEPLESKKVIEELQKNNEKISELMNRNLKLMEENGLRSSNKSENNQYKMDESQKISIPVNFIKSGKSFNDIYGLGRFYNLNNKKELDDYNTVIGLLIARDFYHSVIGNFTIQSEQVNKQLRKDRYVGTVKIIENLTSHVIRRYKNICESRKECRKCPYAQDGDQSKCSFFIGNQNNFTFSKKIKRLKSINWKNEDSKDSVGLLRITEKEYDEILEIYRIRNSFTHESSDSNNKEAYMIIEDVNDEMLDQLNKQFEWYIEILNVFSNQIKMMEEKNVCMEK